MDFDTELREKTSEDNEDELVDVAELKEQEKIGQNQFYDIVTGRQHDWQTIIYDLINTEQLDPWDIDIVILTNKYFERILKLEEESGQGMDFNISSKVLLAAALLLRIKSEFLLNKQIKDIDEILFGKKEEKRYTPEKIEFDENDLPILIPKTPLPRARKVTLDELMSALNKAINTESRRIKREVAIKRAKKLSEVDFPEFKRVDLKERIRQFYARILTSVKKNSTGQEKHQNKVGYSNLVGKEREEKLACFLPVLHLSNTKQLWVEQEKHLEEIWIYLYKYFDKNRDKFIEAQKDLEQEIEEMKEELGISENIDETMNEASNGLEKAKQKRQEKISLSDEAKKELEAELNINIDDITSGIEDEVDNLLNKETNNKVNHEIKELSEEIESINKDKKIEEITGFEDEQE